jgi:sulfonate transport system substrate-binding protein
LTARIAARVAVVLALVTAACVSRSTGPQLITVPAVVPSSQLSGVTLQVGDQKGGTEALLRAAGALDNLPYKIAFSRFTSGPPQIEALAAGKIDFAITGNTPPVFGAAANSKTRVVSAYDGAAAGEQILVRTDSSITEVKDLKAKTILVAKGSAAHAKRTRTPRRRRAETQRRQTGLLAACRRAVGIRQPTGRRLGHLGSLYGASQSHPEGAHYRCR